jgi:hypothetical protein
MDESAARRVLLAQAIETSDAAGRLIAPAERDQVDARARQDALHHGRAVMGADEFLNVRAQRVIAAVGVHHPWLAALQEPRPWQAWLEWLVPIAALVIGVATDAIGNPHRVDLVSLPLLGIVVWNVAVYLILVLGAVWPRSKERRRSWLAHIGRWNGGVPGFRRREGDDAMRAAARFHIEWFRASQALHVERVKRVLHLSAAAWAMGVILSLLVRGLVVEYRVGWESTFLGPQQVYEILRVLRLPALLVLPFDTFTVSDVAQLRFSAGGGAPVGAPWVWMYASLLVTVVILPRLVLATYAAWREERLARKFRFDAHDAYFERVLSLLASTRVQLGLLVHREADRERLLRVIAPDPGLLPVLVSSPAGDVMSIVPIPFVDTPPPMRPAGHDPAGWMARLRSALRIRPDGEPQAHPALAHAREECDVILHAVDAAGHAERARPLLQWLDKPVVEIDMGNAGSGLRFDDFARCWVLDRVLLGAIEQALPAARRIGFGHITSAWQARNDEQLHRSMLAVAGHLLLAARQVEEAQAGTLSVKSLLPAEREAQTSARHAAMERVVRRVEESAASAAAQLRRIHGVDDSAADALEHRLEERFVVQQPVDAPQAGMAGAATGAAMGASVDLISGGLTLGAAAALGALVGGGAAYIAAAWRNRSSPTGATTVQLSDAMLEALLEAALLRYIAIVHWARGWREMDARWKGEVTARMRAEGQVLAGYWSAARTQAPERLVQPLSHELERIAKAVLMHIYPES